MTNWDKMAEYADMVKEWCEECPLSLSVECATNIDIFFDCVDRVRENNNEKRD